MIPDPGRAIRTILRGELVAKGESEICEDGGLPSHVPWGPHIYAVGSKVAWHVMTRAPDGDSWLERMRTASSLLPELKVGVAAPLDLLYQRPIIDALDEIDAAVLPVVLDNSVSAYHSLGLRHSVCDVIYEQRLILDHELACRILERRLAAALAAVDNYSKGALLELTIAIMLSQVAGFEVTDVNIASKNQEVDVHVTNRNSSGLLSRGQVVLAEGKNWSRPVSRREYNAFASKLRSRRGMAKLGVFVTTATFEGGVYVESIRESERDDLIVLLDQASFPALWRNHETVTAGLEHAVKRALYDYEPEL